MSNATKLLEVQDIRKNYGKAESPTQALRGVSFDVLPGEFLGIMGASGSGKTTLLNCIATIIKPTEGKILLNGENIGDFNAKNLARYRGSRIGYLFQDFELLDNLTGRENILLPLSIHGEKVASAETKLAELATFFGIDDVLQKFPTQMSGGEKQRVAAARALISKPDIVLADEPTGALDTHSARLLMDKLDGTNRQHATTILMVTHDANAASFCSRILFIQDGIIFHELRRQVGGKTGDEAESKAEGQSPVLSSETRDAYYARILAVMAQLGGGSANVL